MNTAPSSHLAIVVSRWVGLCVSALLLVVQQRPVVLWWWWLAAAALCLVVSVGIQPYLRLLVRLPALAALELVAAVGLVVATGGWHSPLYSTALSLLALPVAMAGRRGAVLGGLGMSLLTAAWVLLAGMWESAPAVSLLYQSVFLTAPVCVALLGASVPVIWNTRLAPATTAVADVFERTEWIGAVVRRAVPRFTAQSGQRRGDSHTQVQTRVDILRVVLYAPLPATVGMVAQLQALTELFEATAHIAVRFVVLGRPKDILAIHHETIRRVVTEALLNVEQHADAQSVSVLVRFDSRTVTILVQDDGVGLPDSGMYRAGMHSLHMLTYRVAEVGGRLEVFTPSSGGVAVRATYPLQPDEVII